MTDLEISKALALAIGYDEQHIHKGKSGACFVQRWNSARSFMYYHKFDYRDWNVIAPIAEKYNAFPCFFGHANAWIAGAVVGAGYGDGKADTPQKAIALAVIAGAQK